jgi:hypothetical protein
LTVAAPPPLQRQHRPYAAKIARPLATEVYIQQQRLRQLRQQQRFVVDDEALGPLQLMQTHMLLQQQQLLLLLQIPKRKLAVAVTAKGH